MDKVAFEYLSDLEKAQLLKFYPELEKESKDAENRRED